ncbi:hypothetical protein PIB30_095039 [Stylosanthes scabra]|uniref:RNase H type-1 domain-containing protein n=1 Tax=Stylosanthes scabra TaxID=79078 RepID=A0ABU6VVZ0_9FABA|nr:hypothetical protein [Stylosanthes scabra]
MLTLSLLYYSKVAAWPEVHRIRGYGFLSKTLPPFHDFHADTSAAHNGVTDLIRRIHDLMRRDWRVELSLIQKTSNSVADTLAKYAVEHDNLVEITHVPEDIKIPDLQKPLINPYTFYHRQKRSAITNIRHLITRNPSPPVKEIVQSSSLQQCGLQATTSEQYVMIEIPQDLIREYLAQNYTHLHLGAVRLILTLHGRKGLPITVKIALLDTTFKEYGMPS